MVHPTMRSGFVPSEAALFLDLLPCMQVEPAFLTGHGRPRSSGDTIRVRREPCKVLVFSGCNSHPASGSLQPVAIEATRGGNETVGAFETDGSLWRLGEPTGRNRQ